MEGIRFFNVILSKCFSQSEDLIRLPQILVELEGVKCSLFVGCIHFFSFFFSMRNIAITQCNCKFLHGHIRFKYNGKIVASATLQLQH